MTMTTSNLTYLLSCQKSTHGSTEATFAFTTSQTIPCIQVNGLHLLQLQSKLMQKEKNNGKWKKFSMTRSIGAKEYSLSNEKVSQTMKQLGNHWKDSKV